MTVDLWIRDYNPPRCFQKKISGRSEHNEGSDSLELNCEIPTFDIWRMCMFQIVSAEEFEPSNYCQCKSGYFFAGVFFLSFTS
jgi:hypothetical protein